MRKLRYTILGSLLLLSVCVIAQDNDFKLNVDVGLVSLEAIVKDAMEHPQMHLTQNDFEIYEDGRPQDIVHFGAAETPRTMLLIFDVTGVMDKQGPFMAQGMNIFLANIREQDKVGIGVMGPEFEMFMPFRKMEKGKPANVKLPKERIGSNLYESLDMGARRFNKEDGRKAIIAMTDGRETELFNETKRLGYVPAIEDDLHFKKWANDARKRGIPYYFIALDTDPKYISGIDMEYAYFKNPDGYMRSPEYSRARRNPRIAEEYLEGVRLRMEKLAEATGGRVIYPRSLNDVVGLFNQIAIELGYSYSMSFAPRSAGDNGTHSIQVRVKDKSLKVTSSRESYGGLDGKAGK
jgi:VWFA-related protein